MNSPKHYFKPSRYADPNPNFLGLSIIFYNKFKFTILIFLKCSFKIWIIFNVPSGLLSSITTISNLIFLFVDMNTPALPSLAIKI
jgi:hypothetical protein